MRKKDEYNKNFNDAMAQIYEEYDKSYQQGVSDALTKKGIEKDPRYIGVPNINFSLDYARDDEEEFSKQRIERGFDDSELWSLDYTIARFVYPRLKAFSEDIYTTPPGLSVEEWKEKLDKMARAFELTINDDWETSEEYEKQDNEIKEGLNLFCEYFQALWS